ncbi:MAG: polysaccharide biosynthesis/export family protein [Nitrospina sp.]|nr:polysaccharide biosynthesis/export family protein [Nitrospina sp.]
MKFKLTLIVCILAGLFWGSFATANPLGNLQAATRLSVNDAETNIPSSTTFGKENPFVLGPEDMLSISVWGNKELTIMEMPVRPDGTISYPLIGDMKAQGLTPAELKENITQKLRKYIKDASVTVVVMAINSINISVAGEVKAPGTYKINRPVTLMHMFSVVQGFTQQADLRKSYILRDGKKLNVDINALIKDDDFSQNIWLKPNDIIFIHDNFESRVNITGEVKAPQVITYQEGMTIMDAVLLSGGLTDIAKANATQIYRKKGDRSEQNIEKINVELDKVIFDGDLSKNTVLQPGDIIFVPRSFF